MSSRNTYRLTWVSLTLDVGYLFTAAPAEARQLRLTAQMRGGEELPLDQGQGRRPRAPGCDGAGTTERNDPTSKVGGGGGWFVKN